MKDFKTIDEQIEILKSRDLLFQDEERAKTLLLRYGYYEIINGYKDCLLESKSPEKFIEGSTFERLFALYSLDSEIQKSVRDATLEYETLLKTAMAYTIAKHYGVNETAYLNRTNYKSGTYVKNINGTSIYKIDQHISKFNKIINDDSQPFKHYRQKHGHVPPWILFKGASLGNMKYFFSLQKTKIKNEVIQIMLDIPLVLVQQDTESNNLGIKDLFSDTLDLVYKYRNRSSHSGRIFNYKPDKTLIRYRQYFHESIGVSKDHYDNGLGRNDLYTFINALKLIECGNPYINISTGLRYHLIKYLKIYPDDRKFLLTSIGVPEELIEDKIDNIF